MNHVILIGRLGKDPEFVDLKGSEHKIAKLSLATSDKDAEGKERTEWHHITLFGKLATIAVEHLAKGREVCIVGKVTYREYEDKQGNKRTTTDIIGKELKFVGTKNS